VAVVWAFHERPDALQRLIPPWQRVELVSSSEPGLQAGKRVVLRQRVGPAWVTMRAVHVAYEEGRMFADKRRPAGRSVIGCTGTCSRRPRTAGAG
jgi:ligand-binding SRPBCC domain-containing protein